MRVLFLNTTDIGGGAAIAASRLMNALQGKGVETRMLVNQKKGESRYVEPIDNLFSQKYRFLKERLQIYLINKCSKHNLFSIDSAISGADITSHRFFQEADIIHLHWINQGFLSFCSLKKIIESGKPIVWTLHDMWEFTGICHYANKCTFYKTFCRECPFLKCPAPKDLSYQVFKKKELLYANHCIHFVAVSSWLAHLAGESSLLHTQPIHIIPNALPSSLFSLKDRNKSRKLLGLPDNKKILVFGAVRIDDPRKGLNQLNNALQNIINKGFFKQNQLHMALFGGVKDSSVLKNIPIGYTQLGFLSQQKISSLYSAGNIAVVPSLYETFGQTIIEAQACGCTPVAFTGSGQTDIIKHKENGYLAENQSIEDLEKGIIWALNNEVCPSQLHKEAIGRFSEDVVAEHYIKLYKQLI